MATEKRNGAFFPGVNIKRKKTVLSPQNEEAKTRFLNVRGEYSTRDQNLPLDFKQINNWLSRLEQSYTKSSQDQWFHFDAKQLYLDIIRTLPNQTYLDSSHQLNIQQLLNEYKALKNLPTFTEHSIAELSNIENIIACLQKTNMEDAQNTEDLCESKTFAF